MKQKTFGERRCAHASGDVCRQKFPFRNFCRTKLLHWRAQVGDKWKLNEQSLWWWKEKMGHYEKKKKKSLLSFLAIAKKRLVLQSWNFFFFF